MKKITILLLLLSATSMLFSQRIIKEKVKVYEIQLPLVYMPNVKTYNSVWQNDEFKKGFYSLEGEMGYSKKTAKGFMAIHGLNYTDTNPDITVTLNSYSADLLHYEIVDITNGSTTPNYRIVYTVPINWNIKISGKYTETIHFDSIYTVMYPSKEETMGHTSLDNVDPYTLGKQLEQYRDMLYSIAYNEIIYNAFTHVKTTLLSRYAYQTIPRHMEVLGFKSSKNEDMSDWDEPYNKGIELLNEFSSGISPIELYEKYQSIFHFWDQQLLSINEITKQNRKIAEVAFENLITLLKLVNPEAIKDKYLTIYAEENKSRVNEERQLINDAKARQIANKNNKVDYSTLLKKPLVGFYNSYEVKYKTKKGDEKLGTISFATPYGFHPYLTNNEFFISNQELIKDKNGYAIKRKYLKKNEVASYELLGDKYESIDFYDPTAISMGKYENMVEEIVVGKYSLYKFYPKVEISALASLSFNSNAEVIQQSRISPKFVLKMQKKSVLLYNIAKLAELLDDCKPVVDKLCAGEYGNKPFEQRKSFLSKTLQTGLTYNLDENILKNIIIDYNSYE